MRFIHISDVHYGITPDRGRPWSSERAAAVRSTFARVVRSCKQDGIDCLLICGDLFHSLPTDEDLRELNAMFLQSSGTQVVIIAGEHDYAGISSPVRCFDWAPNVHYLAGEGLSSVRLPELDTEITGLSCTGPKADTSALRGLRAPQDGRTHILMAYGGDENEPAFDPQELNGSGFSYVALGHSHRPCALCEGRIVYSGSPEPLGQSDYGRHGCYLGETDAETGTLRSLKFVPLTTLRYISLSVNVTPLTTQDELAAQLRREMTGRGAENIYRIRVSGPCDPAVRFSVDSLKTDFRINEFIDASVPKYDYTRLFAEHPSDMVGFFVQKLNTEDAAPLQKKALNYGVSALLRTSEERSPL